MHDTADILRIRRRRQLIERPSGAAERDPAAVVEHLGAMQAQDYAGSLWSVGLRCAPGTTAADVEAAIADRSIVRTWPMRGTLHLLAPADVRWMLALLTPRITSRATKRHEQLGLTEADFALARKLFTEALTGGHIIGRPEAMELLEANGIATDEQRGYHILWTLAQEALICCGPMEDAHQTFALLDEWVPPGTAQQDSPSAEQALARLAEKYFTARGPATVADFAWWAGITKGDARDGLDAVIHRLEVVTVHGVEYWQVPDSTADREGVETPSVHLLPGFDEYMLGYTDRSIQLGERKRDYGSTVSANGMFSSTLVIDGRVEGTWRRTLRKDHVDINVTPFRKLKHAETDALAAAAERYGAFKGLKAVVHL
jgi:hypothetical protein